jgi:hypothetical protein
MTHDRDILTNLQRIYSSLPNVVVEELRIDQGALNTQRMLDLMAVSSVHGSMPLYLHTIVRILREMRVLQQKQPGSKFDYRAFIQKVQNVELTEAQLTPLIQRLDTLESFMPTHQSAAYSLIGRGALQTQQRPKQQHQSKPAGQWGTDWKPKVSACFTLQIQCPVLIMCYRVANLPLST